MSAIIDAIGSAITSVSNALGIKDVLDSAFRGSEIVVASASFSRLYSIKLDMPIVKQTAISALLGNRSVVDELILTIQKSPARNLEKAYAYAMSQQTSETYAYSASYVAAMDIYSQDTIDYTNSVNDIKNSVTFTVVNSKGSVVKTYVGYDNLLNALNASDADTKFPTIATEVLPSTTPKTYTYNYQKQNALNALAQADTQIDAISAPTFNPPTQLGYYYYRLPDIQSSGFLATNLESYPIIIIKREGGYAATDSDEYNSTLKLSNFYGFDYDSLKKSILNIDTPDVKAAGVMLGVDLFSNTVAAKQYISGFFDSIIPYGTTQPIEEISYVNSYQESGTTLEEVITYINPYIKVSESSINLFITIKTSTKYTTNTSDSEFLQRLHDSPTVDVVRTDDNGKYSININKYVNDSSYLSIYVEDFTLQTYVATDTSYHGTEIGMFTFKSSATVATDSTDPLILPLLRAPYLLLGPLDRIDLSRESGFLIMMSAQVVALTWVQEHAALIQVIAVVFAVFTMGQSLAVVGTATATTAAGVATTTVTYSISALVINFAVNVVIILAIKELAIKLFPDNEFVQLAATALTMYYLSDSDFSSGNSLEDVLNDRSLIDNMLKYSQAAIDVYNQGLQEKLKKDKEQYTVELNKLTEEYNENAAKLEALPQLTDLVREDFRNGVLLRNKVKPSETVDMFYTRTLNSNLAEVSTNPSYYYNSKLSLNNIA
jgi:hypothetical protein